MSCALISHMHTHTQTLTHTHAHIQRYAFCAFKTHHTDFKYTTDHIIRTHINPIVIVILIVIVITFDTSDIRWFQDVID